MKATGRGLVERGKTEYEKEIIKYKYTNYVNYKIYCLISYF